MPRLAPLACGQCKGPVPLCEGLATTCPHCKAVVELPEAHRALREADAARAAADTELAALFARLSRPPGRFVRVWGSVTRAVLLSAVQVSKWIGWGWLYVFALLGRLHERLPMLFAGATGLVALILLFMGISWVGAYSGSYSSWLCPPNFPPAGGGRPGDSRAS